MPEEIAIVPDTSQMEASGLTEDDLKFLHESLLEERKKIQELFHHDMKAGKSSVEEASEDIVDRANMAYNRELNFALSDSERKQLRSIEEALQRVENGSYGVCMHSGKPIGLERLKIVPWAKYRVEFQELAEKGMLEEEH